MPAFLAASELSSFTVQLLAGLAVLGIWAILVGLVRIRRDFRSHREELTRDFMSMRNDLTEVRVVLGGEASSPLNPSPPPGLVAQVNKTSRIAVAAAKGVKVLLSDHAPPGGGGDMRAAAASSEIDSALGN